MFKIISLIIWSILITLSLIWFLNNSGWIDITWLGFEIRIDILTFILSFIIFLAAIFLIYRFYSFVIAIILGIFGIFRVSEEKKHEKEIEKYENAIELIRAFMQAINSSDLKEARILQKRINSLLKNEELNNELLLQLAKLDNKIQKNY